MAILDSFGSQVDRNPVLVNGVFGVALVGLPVLWNETPVAYSLVWTATVSVLIAITAVRHPPWALTSTPGALGALFLISYPLFCALSYLVSSWVSAEKEAQFSQDLKEVVFVTLYFVLGHCCAGSLSLRSAWGTYLACLIYIVFRREVFMDPELFYLLGLERGGSLNYQHLGDAFVVSAIILLSLLSSSSSRVMLLIVTCVGLYILPSRSSLLLGAICLVYAVFHRHWRIVFAVGAGLSIGGPVFLNQREVQSALLGTRLEALLLPQEDESYVLRQAALQQGMEAIRDSPLFGVYQFQLDSFGIPGLYVHNMLNTWAQAGFFSFVLLCLFIISAVLAAKPTADGNRVPIAMALVLFATVSWCFTRTTMSALMFFSFGMAIGEALRRE